jgi:hypothetical protein
VTNSRSISSRTAGESLSSSGRSTGHYFIRRRGSRYNIFGPQGRLFRTYQSASVAGPRWEELTGTPWPYRSTAYQAGLRLWQLGALERREPGAELVHRDEDDAEGPEVPVTQAGSIGDSPDISFAAGESPAVLPLAPSGVPLALPAPRFDLARQQYLMHALQENPRRLFEAEMRQVLQREVEYHLPQARLARRLLKWLERYEARRQRGVRRLSSETILARHIAWQEQRLAGAASVSAKPSDVALAR